MKMRALVVAIAAATCASSMSGAAVFECIASDGKHNFQTAPCPVGSGQLPVPLGPTQPPLQEERAANCGPVKMNATEGARAEAVAKVLLKQQLKDPDSARFTGMHHGKESCDGAAVTLVCGRYNARNGFGGYTGDKQFTVTIDGDGGSLWTEEMGGTPGWDGALRCTKASAASL